MHKTGKAGNGDELIKEHTHILTKFIILRNINQIYINRLSAAVMSRVLGIYSKLFLNNEIIRINELIGKINSDSFMELFKKSYGSKESLKEYDYFDDYDDKHFHKLLLNLKEDYRLMVVKMDGQGIERDKQGNWSINEKAKHSIYTLNKWLILEEIDILLQEIEYALKDRKYNYIAELMYYAGRLFERAKVILFERNVITGIRVNKHSSDSGKEKGAINRKRKGEFQEYINEYVKTLSYLQSCKFTAKKCGVSVSTIKRFTYNPNSKKRLSVNK